MLTLNAEYQDATYGTSFRDLRYRSKSPYSPNAKSLNAKYQYADSLKTQPTVPLQPIGTSSDTLSH